MTFDLLDVSSSGASNTIDGETYYAPPRAFSHTQDKSRATVTLVPGQIGRAGARRSRFSGVSSDTFSSLLARVAFEIEDTLPVSSSRIDTYGQLKSYVDAMMRRVSVSPTPKTENLHEIKLLTDYSWGKIAEIIGVDRRSVSTWIGGGEIREQNARTIADVLATLLFIDRGFAEENRKLLDAIGVNGKSAFDCLIAGEYDAVRTALGPGAGRQTISWGASRGIGEAERIRRKMLTHPGADPEDVGVSPDDTPPPPLRKLKARRI